MLVWLIVSALSGISATEPTLHPQVGFIMNITRSNKLREGVQKKLFFSSLLLLREIFKNEDRDFLHPGTRRGGGVVF